MGDKRSSNRPAGWEKMNISMIETAARVTQNCLLSVSDRLKKHLAILTFKITFCRADSWLKSAVMKRVKQIDDN